jgi:hypothetical protein
MLVYKQFRVCRLHFAPECFNGACKRLLNTVSLAENLNTALRNMWMIQVKAWNTWVVRNFLTSHTKSSTIRFVSTPLLQIDIIE